MIPPDTPFPNPTRVRWGPHGWRARAGSGGHTPGEYGGELARGMLPHTSCHIPPEAGYHRGGRAVLITAHGVPWSLLSPGYIYTYNNVSVGRGSSPAGPNLAYLQNWGYK